MITKELLNSDSLRVNAGNAQVCVHCHRHKGEVL